MNEVKRVVSVVLYLVAWGRGERHDRDIVSWYFCDRRYVSRFLSMVTTENQWNDSVSVKDPYSIEKNKLSIKKKPINSFQRPTVRDRDAYDVSRKRVWWDRLWRYGYCVVLSLGPGETQAGFLSPAGSYLWRPPRLSSFVFFSFSLSIVKLYTTPTFCSETWTAVSSPHSLRLCSSGT